MKPVLNYAGGKWGLSKWITSYFPEHKVYLEPFCGSGAVFFNKNPCLHETINDIDGRIENFFKVCRDHPDKLAKLIYFTPYSRQSFEDIREDHAGSQIKLTGNSIEDARRFLIRCTQGFGSKLSDRVGWKNTKASTGPWQPRNWSDLPNIIIEVAERLKKAQIECKPAVELIKAYNFNDCLIYVDPPYLFSTRSKRIYTYEMGIKEEHEELLQVLLNHKGYVVLSGYENELYNENLKGWDKVVKTSVTNSGATKVEVIWLNYKISKQLDLDSYMHIFNDIYDYR